MSQMSVEEKVAQTIQADLRDAKLRLAADDLVSRQVERDAGTFEREVGEIELHLVAGDVLDLREVLLDLVDQARLAGGGDKAVANGDTLSVTYTASA